VESIAICSFSLLYQVINVGRSAQVQELESAPQSD
jgi:hypothetical protein